MKRKKLRKRRFLAMLLVFVLCMGMLDISAFAAVPGEDIAAGSDQKEESGEESGQETEDSQKGNDRQSDGAQNSEGSKPSGDTQNSGGSELSGDTQNPAGSEPSGDTQNPGDAQQPNGAQDSEKSQPSGDTQNTGTNPESVKVEVGGDTETGENPKENLTPEYASIEEFLAAAAAIGETDDEDSVREAIENCLDIYGRLSEEDKADEAVQKAYEAVKAYEEDLGQGGIDTLDDTDTYTVIYRDSAEDGGTEFQKFEGLKKGDATPEYQASWFDGKDKDFYAWSPSWNKVVEGDKHEIVYTATYKDPKERYLLTIYYQWAGSREKAAFDYTATLYRGDEYEVESPALENVPFDYEVNKSQKVIKGTVEGATHDIKFWVTYSPKVKIQHIYRVNGKVVGEVEDPNARTLSFGQTLTADSYGINKKNIYNKKYYTYTDANTVTLPSDPSELKEQPVLKLYYDLSAPEFTISKTANKTEVKPGEEVIYTITVENVGGRSGYAKVKDALPEGLEFISYDIGGGEKIPKNIPLQYSLGGIDAGKNSTLKIKAKVSEDVTGDITITNTATAVLDNIDVASANADITVAKTYPLTVHFRWWGADEEFNKVAPDYTTRLKEGEPYSVPIPKADVPFTYTTNVKLDGKGDKLEGTMTAVALDLWVDYYPLFQVKHIYRRDGDVVAYALWTEDNISWYNANALGSQALTYGEFNSEIENARLFRYPWIFWDYENKPNEYETFTFTSEDKVTLPGNPADLKATPVVNMYYDRTTYVDVAVRYIYVAEDGTETELLEEYKKSFAKKSDYDVSEFAYETITADGVSYRQDSVEGDLKGTATEDKTVTVKYVIVEETPENPTDPTPPVNPPTGGGGGGGGTPDPTPTPPTLPAPDPIPVVPIPVDPVPQAVVPNVTPVDPTPVAEAAPAAVTAEIAEEAVPLAEGEETEDKQTVEVEEEAIPLAGGEGGSWALFNFALMNLAIFESIMLLIGYFVHTKNDEEERKLKKKGLFRIISLPIAVISLIVFILTENIHLQTALVDKYTIIMLLIAIVQTVMVVLSNKKYEEEQEEQ